MPEIVTAEERRPSNMKSALICESAAWLLKTIAASLLQKQPAARVVLLATLQGSFPLHWPLINSDHMRVKLAKRELEKKRIEDDQRSAPCVKSLALSMHVYVCMTC